MQQVKNETNNSKHPASAAFNFSYEKSVNSSHGSSYQTSVSNNLTGNTTSDQSGRLLFKFKSKELEAVYIHQESKNYPKAVVKGFLKAIWMISAAKNEQDLYTFKSLKFHKLNRNCKQEYALSLTGNWRLITKFEEEGGIKYLSILKIEDYH